MRLVSVSVQRLARVSLFASVVVPSEWVLASRWCHLELRMVVLLVEKWLPCGLMKPEFLLPLQHDF